MTTADDIINQAEEALRQSVDFCQHVLDAKTVEVNESLRPWIAKWNGTIATIAAWREQRKGEDSPTALRIEAFERAVAIMSKAALADYDDGKLQSWNKPRVEKQQRLALRALLDAGFTLGEKSRA